MAQGVSARGNIGEGGRIKAVRFDRCRRGRQPIHLAQIVHFLIAQSLLRQPSFQTGAQQHLVKGFGEIILRAQFDPFDHAAQIGHGRDDDHRNVAPFGLGLQLAQNLKAIHLRHHNIEQDQIRLFRGHLRQRLSPIGRADGGIAQIVEFLLQGINIKGFVIDDQDFGRLVH